MQSDSIKKDLRKNAWVDVPCHEDVMNILKDQRTSDTYYKRGSGEATRDLDAVEVAHREWVKEIIDLTDFKHCYFVNGATDAIHHWVLTEKRPWQKLEGEYEYADVIGPKSTVCCDVPGQYMNEETGRSGIGANVDPNKPLFVSIPSAADGNYFDPQAKRELECPVILDCTYVSSTAKQRINVPKNTEQVFFSFSKGFGLVGQRLGLVYTKKPHATLQLLKEFENWNYSGVRTIELIMKNFAVDEMWKRHKEQQIKICNEYNFKPSDCFFLATTRDSFYRRRRRMRWNDTARICITSLINSNGE